MINVAPVSTGYGQKTRQANLAFLQMLTCKKDAKQGHTGIFAWRTLCTVLKEINPVPNLSWGEWVLRWGTP